MSPTNLTVEKCHFFDCFQSKKCHFCTFPLGLDRGLCHSCTACPSVVSVGVPVVSKVQKVAKPSRFGQGFQTKTLIFMIFTDFHCFSCFCRKSLTLQVWIGLETVLVRKVSKWSKTRKLSKSRKMVKNTVKLGGTESRTHTTVVHYGSTHSAIPTTPGTPLHVTATPSTQCSVSQGPGPFTRLHLDTVRDPKYQHV